MSICYRVRELDDEWYRTAADNFSLLNLRHGEYHLQVREAGGNGMAEALFVIRRPFLLTGWAWVLYVFIVAGLITAGSKDIQDGSGEAPQADRI
ncbi:MAG: hypothetical protein MZV63_69210 [Marinilabiliales bacterium]|nr:hypothetical protein [Marinilabiliales bacterium]